MLLLIEIPDEVIWRSSQWGKYEVASIFEKEDDCLKLLSLLGEDA